MTPRLFRGTVAASALVFDEHALGRVEAQRRALACWTPGARLRRTPIGLTLTLPAAKRIAVTAAPGLPLVALGGALVGMDATIADVRALGASAGGIIVVRAGRIDVVPEGEDVAPHDWIALGPVTVVETRALSEPRPITLAAPVPSRPLHEVLGPAIPPPAEERQAFLRDAGTPSGAGGFVPGLGLFGWFRTLLRRKFRAARGAGASSRAAYAEPTRFGARLRDLFSSVKRWVGLQRLLGRRYGRYLANVIEMLNGGDVREGLRHAIPLASMKEIFDRRRAHGPTWRLPSGRPDLSISPVRTQSSSRVILADDLLGQLRALYQRTFERLDAQGRHEEAAFVLAELLQDDEGAVAYLERNGEYRRAAELAEARGCASGLIVRAWFLAGDRDRAVRVARERGAFHDAIARLEKSHPDIARQLRWLWADALAAAGSYADAVELARSIVEAQDLVLRWIELGLAADEAQAPRLLAYQAALVPERWAETRALAELWMTSQQERAAGRRRALIEALPKAPSKSGSKRLARLCARWLLARASSDVPAIPPEALRALVDSADDDALEADLPSARPPNRARWIERHDVVTETIAPCGPVPVRDAVLLSSGRLLVAQGEAGVALLGRTGAALHRFDCPADALVISDASDRAIALARRGASAQLTQLDLPARRHRPWGLVAITGGAKTYDGNVWFAHDGLRMMGLDAMAATPRCFWAVDVEDGSVVDIIRSPSEVMMLAGGWGMETWRYELPGPTLRERKPIKLARETSTSEEPASKVVFFGTWIASGGGVYAVVCNIETRQLCVHAFGTSRLEASASLDAEVDKLVVAGATTHEMFALAFVTGPDAEVRLYDRQLGMRAKFRFPATTLPPRLRFCGADLVMAADGGRLTIFDTDRGTLRTVAVL